MKCFSLKQYLEELAALVNIDSGLGAPEGATQVGLMLAEPLVRQGWILERHSLSPKAGECIVVKNREAERYDALLVGHTDTVFPAGEAAKRPFSCDETRAYGVGVLDMKQGCLAAVHALMGLSKEALDALAIAVIFNPDEEIFSPYSAPLIDAYARRSAHAFVFEAASTDGSHTIARKGLMRFDYAFHGRSGHAGYAFENGGISAVNEMAYWIMELAKLHDKASGTSVNAGVARGGTAANIIADYAELSVDVRYVTKKEMERVKAELLRLKAHAAEAGVGLTELSFRVMPPLEPDVRTHAYVERVKAVSEGLGLPFYTKPRGGCSDANHISACGPVVLDGLGPTGDDDHSPDEYLELSTVEPSIRLARALLEELAAEKLKERER